MILWSFRRTPRKLDWEVELAVVIGKKASYISKEESFEFVAGYTLHNDYSERSFQLERGGQWVKGKSADTFCSAGPICSYTGRNTKPETIWRCG